MKSIKISWLLRQHYTDEPEHLLLPHVNLEGTCHEITTALHKPEPSIFGFLTYTITPALATKARNYVRKARSCYKFNLIVYIQLSVYTRYSSQHVNKREFSFLCLCV